MKGRVAGDLDQDHPAHEGSAGAPSVRFASTMATAPSLTRRLSLGKRLKRLLLEIPAVEVSFRRRGFPCTDSSIRVRLERIGYVFLDGYHSALDAHTVDSLVSLLDSLETQDRGFAYEGAAMCLALQATLMPWRWGRVSALLRVEAHRYMVHVGVGWALAVLPLPITPFLHRLDPLLRWLAVDGFGFHHGFFSTRRYLEERRVPARLRGYARRAFDQGLGRALWFAQGADVAGISKALSSFPESRQADLWSGVGLACAYAGGVADGVIQELRVVAGKNRGSLAQGACFAAKTRQRAGNPASHTDRACRVLCGMPAAAAAAVTDDALADLPADSAEAYETWRRRIQSRFAEALVG